MKVSIVIPTYNRSDYIVDTVNSVFAQGMQDFELIIINDGSTDDTEEKLAPFMDRIVYKKTPNRGMAASRNEGMLLAQGEYIACLDDDDLYYPYKLEIQAAILDQHQDIGLVYSEFSGFDNHDYFDRWHLKTYHSSAYKRGGLTYDTIFGKKIKISNYPDVTRALMSEPEDWHDHYVYFGNIYESYLMNTIVFTNSIMFRRSVLEKSGLQNSYYGYFHDLEFVLRICKYFDVAFIDIPTYKLRYHENQVSTTQGPRSTQNAIKKQRNLLNVTKKYALYDQTYYAANKQKVDRQLAMLYRAVAVPLISYYSDDKHKTKYYPRRARAYLKGCKHYHKTYYFLCLLSYLPHFMRRAGFKLLELQRQHNR